MKTVALFFGGLSNEAEVSVMSAKNVVKYFDYRRYKLILIYWRKADRRFYLVKDVARPHTSPKSRVAVEDFSKLFDTALLMTHGRYGEDGVLQAILESQGLRYCGCRVLGSALCMDKAIYKDLISASAIKQTKYIVLDFKSETAAVLQIKEKQIKKTLRLPLYVKPANSGSSVGITKVEKYSALAAAIKSALKHDTKIIIEEGLINPKEIEVAVLGNAELIVSRPGELSLAKDFYDYDDKYKKGEAQVVIPARLSAAQEKEIRRLAAEIYRLTAGQGFARVDFFVAGGKVYINEINTLPGFTDISMFPQLLMKTGLSYTELLNRIIALAY
jgi:D-alanine-D-alanine ligase